MRLALSLWLPLMLWGERLAFLVSGRTCEWPALSRVAGGDACGDPVRVAVIADPQLADHTSYAFAPHGSWTLAVVERLADVYQHRAFRSAVLPLRPQHILFLGDLVDGGFNTARMQDYHASRRRFERVFRWPRQDPTSDRPPRDPAAFAAAAHPSYRTVHGNHDVGYANAALHFPQVVSRHEAWFGSSDYVARIGAVDLVAVNAPALGEGPPGASEIARRAWAHVRKLRDDVDVSANDAGKAFAAAGEDVEEKREGSSEGSRSACGRSGRSRIRPRVLVTHIPLPRETYLDGTCGPRRVGPILAARVKTAKVYAKTPDGGRVEVPDARGEVSYQDYLTDAVADELLSATRPVMILSGHDHDHCDTARGASTEHTLGAFGWLMGNPRPSFGMLTLRGDDGGEKEGCDAAAMDGDAPTNPARIAAFDTCALPRYLLVVRGYGFLGVASVAWLLAWPSLRVASGYMRESRVAFARAFGVDPASRAPLVAAAWRHCGPFLVVLFVVFSTLVATTLADLRGE